MRPMMPTSSARANASKLRRSSASPGEPVSAAPIAPRFLSASCSSSRSEARCPNSPWWIFGWMNLPIRPLAATRITQASATVLLRDPSWKLAWKRMATGPTIPSSMCVPNQWRIGPHERIGRNRFRSE